MQRKGSNGPAEDGTLLLDVWFVRNLTGRLLDDALRPVGLTADEFGLYSLLYGYGPLTQTQITRWTGIALTTVSGSIRRFTSRGHLRDMPNPDDARSRMVELTDEGIEVTFAGAQILAPILPRLIAELRSGAGPTRAALADLDQGLRQLAEAAPRPYTIETPRTAALNYDGEPLTAAQTAEVRRYIDWLRVRDATP